MAPEETSIEEGTNAIAMKGNGNKDGAVATSVEHGNKQTEVAVDSGSNNTNDNHADADATAPKNSSTTAASPEPTPTPSTPTPTVRPDATAVGASGGFFSRMGSLGSTAAPILGDVYDRAQKRAVQLREQAATEVERLRQQREEQAAAAAAQQEDIPPATGILVGGSTDTATKEAKEDTVANDLKCSDQTKEMDEQQTGKERAAAADDTTKDKEEPKKSTINSSIRDAFKIVRDTSAGAAKELIFPIDAFAAPKDNEIESYPDSSHCSSYSQDSVDAGSDIVSPRSAASEDAEDNDEEKSSKKAATSKPPDTPKRRNSNSSANSAAPQSTLTPTKFSAFSNTLGSRFRKLKESASFDGQQSPEKQKDAAARKSPIVVGGADRVGGLRNFHLEGIFGDAALPPSLPLAGKKTDLLSQPPPGRDNLAMQTGGQWTMASNRGPHAVIGSSSAASTRSANDAASITATSEAETASEDGLMAPVTPITLANGKPPITPQRTGRTSYYEHAVRSALKPGQRALFFGKGTMGVVLKPTYLASWRGKDGQGLLCPTMNKQGGVFIDSLIPGGHAEKSGVVFVGDQVIKIGSVNVENMTLEEVVNVIVETKRPNIIIFTSEHDVQVVDRTDEEAKEGGNDEGEFSNKKGFTSALDLVFGFTNKLVAEGGVGDMGLLEKGHELNPTTSMNSLLDNDGDEDEDGDGDEEVLFASPGKDVNAKSIGVDVLDSANEVGKSQLESENDIQTPETRPETLQTETSSISTSMISFDIETLTEYASHQTNKLSDDAETQKKKPLLLKRAALFNADFRHALRLSLSECVADPRRYSYLVHFFKNYQSKKELELKECNGEDTTVDDNDVTSSKNQLRLLELYLDLCQFHNAMLVCSVPDREKMLSQARKISTRFLLDDDADDQHDSSVLPEYVAHVALGGMEKVQAVKFALRDEDDFFEGDNGGDGFDSIRSSLQAFLSTQDSYLSFLISDECALMRAYLRGKASFVNIEPQMFLKSSTTDSAYHNFLLHAILHLICLKERDENGKTKDENFIKNDALLLSSGKRNMGATSMLGCSIFIMRSLSKSMKAAVEGLIEDGMTGASSNGQLYTKLIDNVQFFWEVFIAPAGGSLSSLALSQDAQDALDAARRLIVSSVDKHAEEKSSDENSEVSMARALCSPENSSSVQSLAEALLREYTLKIYPDFRRHVFHEWACKEATFDRDDSFVVGEYLVSNQFDGLKKGWMNRFMRQMELPEGLSLHRPSPVANLPKEDVDNTTTTPDKLDYLHNGDVALVFGSGHGDEASEHNSLADDIMRRYSCVSVLPEIDGPSENVLLPQDIPPIFENYAMVPPFHERPFQGMLQDANNNRVSIDGWEVSLTNFVIPSQASGADDDGKWMYCVSLVFHKSPKAVPQISESEINRECVCELQYDGSASSQVSTGFESPLFTTESIRKMKVSKELKEFNSKLQGQQWSQQSGRNNTICIALISSRNVTQAMRETLTLLYNDFCSVSSSGPPRFLCQPLVDVLGVLSNSQTVEEASLSSLLQPYAAFTTSKWVHRPLSDQSDIFSEAAGMQLLQSLPPVPLALAFVTLLLEQKVVFSSSRRGMLMSASFAMMKLLKPLKWAHLQVPLVPVSMMDELIHYPAPFMLGIPTDEKESAAILGALPHDVTLIDLDVGRVILASVFANDSTKSSDGEIGEAVAGALRSQVLYLAESLGGAFGAAIHQNSWCIDSPLQDFSAGQNKNQYSGIVSICEDFISELLSGIHSCCMWIGENHGTDTGARNECAIIFDEDRFYHIKNLRAEGRNLPLIPKRERSSRFTFSLDHFDLIFETFLRTQSLSTFISEGSKESMLFW